MIKGKSPEEIRKTFNIKNDFTEEEEAQVSFKLKLLIFKMFKLLFLQISCLSKAFYL